MFCRNCGAPTDEAAQFCIKCGANLKEAAVDEPPVTPPEFQDSDPTGPPGASAAPPPPGAVPADQWSPPASQRGGAWPPAGVAKSKLAAGLLGIFLGAFGAHRFYLGYNSIAIVQLVLGLAGIVTCGITTIAAAIWGLIDGIMILTGSISTDANGVPLRD